MSDIITHLTPEDSGRFALRPGPHPARRGEIDTVVLDMPVRGGKLFIQFRFAEATREDAEVCGELFLKAVDEPLPGEET